MSKRRNLVILDGPLSIHEVKVMAVDDEEVLAVMCWVETDRPALGGRHQVVTYGPLARKVKAFVQAQGGPVDATVDGWLRSKGEVSVVIADRIAFHATADVVDLAKRILAVA
jgi:hypothetical protein